MKLKASLMWATWVIRLLAASGSILLSYIRVKFSFKLAMSIYCWLLNGQRTKLRFHACPLWTGFFSIQHCSSAGTNVFAQGSLAPAAARFSQLASLYQEACRLRTAGLLNMTALMEFFLPILCLILSRSANILIRYLSTVRGIMEVKDTDEAQSS